MSERLSLERSSSKHSGTSVKGVLQVPTVDEGADLAAN